TFNSLGIPSLAINEDTLRAGRNRGNDLWAQLALPHLRCLLLSPEQLSSKAFNTALSNRQIYSRIIALNVDEIHLILSWGAPGFRLCFRDVGNVLMRLPRSATLTGVTATLPAGVETRQLTAILGLKPRSFVFTRRSNQRPELQLIFRTLRHGLQGWSFPDLEWILDHQRKTMIYCRTISLAFRLRFRLYCALFSHQYNSSSLDMFVNNTDCQILISTDALKVGNDFPNVDDVIILNPESPEDVLQMGGRAGRKQPYSNPGPRAICYYTQSTMRRANAVLENGKDEQNSSDQNYSRHGKMTVQMAKLILTGCITAELDSQFGNPAEDSRCFCESFSTDMRDYGSNALRRFRFRIRKKSQSPRLRSLPPAALLHNDTISGIFDVFSQLRSVADLSPYVNGFLQGHEQSLLAEIEELRKKFGRMNIGLDPDERYVVLVSYGL
ncbi:P-loop containing nucleoside triphosphate hydrolase protein, partial [Lentinula aff. detonsa]